MKTLPDSPIARMRACFLALALAAPAVWSAPMPACDTASIAAAGFAPQALCRVLDASLSDGANVHAILVMRHGALVVERYYAGKDRSIWSLFARTVQFDADTRHDLRSVSKSVTSLLWGIAQAEGRTPGLDTPVLDLYPELADLKTGGRGAITLRQLFTMTSGLAWEEPIRYGMGNDETGLYWRSSQARYLFDRPLAASNGFNYNGGATAVLADILARRTGMPVTEYARHKLFAPLGITDWEWQTDLRGRPMAFAGLRMRPRDLLRIGQLVLQRGQWQGRQIVPAAWIDESLAPRVETGDGLQYGYQWWSGTVEALGGRHRWHAAVGNGGQRLFVVPALDLVVVITAGGYNEAGSGRHANGVFRALAASLTP
ncbi:serine hydrolase [Massilia sp. 9I]|uniref:serine hydrolase domain-containing protein n=1 Tax=Massilia sp. 9I TaxID=2653152 RepID=UPI0012F13E12|nr:serine hydrolase [Massilia sp. 9I]VXC36869.1 CubicO group peptidase, beta-lactamase class C family [Massilia sp. 9I]